MKKKILIPVCIILSILIVLSAASVFIVRRYSLSVSKGLYLSAANNTPMMIQMNSPIQLRNLTNNENLFDDLTDGDEILVIHDGIQESYPGATGVYTVFKLTDGDLSDIPENVLESLSELGWFDTKNLQTEIEKETTSNSTEISFVTKVENTKKIAPSDLPEEVTDHKSWNPQEVQWIKLAEIENSDIDLYATADKTDHIFLRWDGQFVELNWDILDSILRIELYLSDFDNDGKDELIAIPILSGGTHFEENDIHIFEMNTFSVDEYIISARGIKNFITDNIQLQDNKITFFEASVITDKADEERFADDIYILQTLVDKDIKFLAYIDTYGAPRTLATLTIGVSYQNGIFVLNSFKLDKWNS